MKKRFNELQIIGIIKEQESGCLVADICRRHGIDQATFYKWKSRYGGLEISEATRLSALEDENRRLKKLLEKAELDKSILKDALSKKW